MMILIVAAALANATPASDFAAANRVAMDRMMTAMGIVPSGDVDTDFVAMMEPHHRGAIDMAVFELRYGSNLRLRRIAQAIIVEQREEIDAMRLALGRPPTPPTAVPTQQEHRR